MLRAFTNKKIRRTFLLSLGSLFLSGLYLLFATQVAHAGLGDDIASALGDLIPSVDNILGNIVKGIGFAIYTLAAMLASFSGQALDLFIQISLDTSNYGLEGVLIGWRVFRDVVNMVFIFVLLYVAIMMILQLSNFQTKRILVNLILVGIFLNFSFFITGFVIDIGNVAAGAVYNAVTTEQVQMGGKLNEALNLGKILEASGKAAANNMLTGLVYILSAILLFIASFVFLSAGFLFLFRTVILIFLLMLSPVAFAAYAVPNMSKYFNMWLGKLISNTFVAPVFLLLMAIIIVIADNGALSEGITRLVGVTNPLAASTSGSLNPFQGVSGIIINYIMLVGLMVASLNIAKSMASEASNLATKAAGGTIGLGIGATGALGRNTIGKFSSRTLDRNSSKWKERASQGGVGGWVARQRLKTYGAASKSTFDARNSKVASGTFKSTVGAALGAGGTNVQVGTGSKTTFQGRVDARKKRDEDFAKDLGYDKKKEGEIMKDADAKIAGHEDTFTKADEEYKTVTRDIQAMDGALDQYTQQIENLATSLAAMEKLKQEGSPAFSQQMYDDTQSQLTTASEKRGELKETQRDVRSGLESKRARADAARKNARSAANVVLNDAKQEVSKLKTRRTDDFANTLDKTAGNQDLTLTEFKHKDAQGNDLRGLARLGSRLKEKAVHTAEYTKATPKATWNFVVRGGRTRSELTSASKAIKSQYGGKVESDLNQRVKSMNVKGGGKFADGSSDNSGSASNSETTT